MRIAVARFGIETDLLQHFDDLVVALVGRQFRRVDLQPFLDDLGD